MLADRYRLWPLYIGYAYSITDRTPCVSWSRGTLEPDISCRHCLHYRPSMRSRVHVTVAVGCPSVCPSACLSHYLTAAATTCGGFAAGRHACKRYRSTAPTAATAPQHGALASTVVCGRLQNVHHKYLTSPSPKKTYSIHKQPHYH